jgi:hypothetical protein
MPWGTHMRDEYADKLARSVPARQSSSSIVAHVMVGSSAGTVKQSDTSAVLLPDDGFVASRQMVYEDGRPAAVPNPHGSTSLSAHSMRAVVSSMSVVLIGVTSGHSDPQQYGHRMIDVTVDRVVLTVGTIPIQSTAIGAGGSWARE